MRSPSLACGMLMGLLVLPAIGRADLEFDYAIERFEVDGNLHGPFDGTNDFVDEFDDDVFGTPFLPAGGTAVEEGGALHVRSPGFPVTIPGLTPVPVVTSEVMTEQDPPFFQDGQGDAVVRSYWRPQPMDRNDWIHMSFGFAGANGWEFAGLALSNFTRPLADLYSPPFPSGYAMTAHHEAITSYGRFLSLEHRPIDPSAITGAIVFELRFDDDADTIAASYSLDGGTTYTAAFAPISVTFLSGSLAIYLGADPRDMPCPPVLWVQKLSVAGLTSSLGEQRLVLRGTLGGSPQFVFGTDPLRLVLTDEGAGGAPLLDVTLPDWATAYQQPCGVGDAWIGNRRGRRYRNLSGALPPECVAGSANGIRDVRLRWNGTTRFKVKAKGTAIANITGPVKFAMYRNPAPVDECEGYVGTASCRPLLSGARVKCAYE